MFWSKNPFIHQDDKLFYNTIFEHLSKCLLSSHLDRIECAYKRRYELVLKEQNNIGQARYLANSALSRIFKKIIHIPGIEVAFMCESDLRKVASGYAKAYKYFDMSGARTFTLKGTRPPATPEEVESIIAFQDIPGDTYQSRLRRAQDYMYWIRRLRVIATEAAEIAAYHLKLVNKNTPYCSDYNQKRRAYQKKRNKQTLERTFIGNGQEVICLADVARTPEHRAAELCAASKGLETIANEKGYTWLFVTCTCPAYMHPCPVQGKNSWSGISPKESAGYLQRNWVRVRAMLAKSGTEVFGMWCREPHKSGAPHQHFLIYCSNADIDRVVRCLNTHCNHSSKDPFRLSSDEIKQGVIFGTPALQVKRALSQDDGGASAATYIQKYIQKSVSDLTDDSALAVEAAAATFRYRRYGFFGIKAGLTLYRLLRKASVKEVPEFSKAACECAQVGDFSGYLKNLYPELKPLRENYLNSYGESNTRIVGIIDTETNEQLLLQREWEKVERPQNVGIDEEKSSTDEGLQINIIVQGGRRAPPELKKIRLSDSALICRSQDLI